MKKVILFAAVAATVALASCGKKADVAPVDSTAVVDSAATTVDTTAVDTTAADSAVAAK
jgi:nitrous oxide reductase accessory protein NosL